jgi:hypothetical protein
MPTTPTLEGVTRLMRLAELGPDGSLWVAGADGPIAAGVLTSVSLTHLRRALRSNLPLLVAGDEQHPVVIGVVLGQAEDGPALSDVDGNTVLTAARQLVLRCGAAAITISADGQVSISGTDVRSRAKRLQRITGANVKIN